jgi:cysteinyl-tRNA synthetase
MIDIHSGGEDNIFPHHECELAQACCATGQTHFARYWLHTRFLIVEGEKMSKSRGNFFTVRDLLARGASPAAIRLELIGTHYGKQANFTFQSLKEKQRQIERFARLERWLLDHRDVGRPSEERGPLASAVLKFTGALCANLNVSGALAALEEAAGEYDVTRPPQPGRPGRPTYVDELDALRAMDSVLGVLDLDRAVALDDRDAAAIEACIAERNAARARRDWAMADRIRQDLSARGIEIKDGPEGTTWSRVVKSEG